MTRKSPSLSPDHSVYLVRHATPDWTRTDIPYHLPPGPDLNEKGKIEALLLRTYLRQVGVRLIVSSPLERCLQTAHLVADPGLNGHSTDPILLETWPALMELQPEESPASIRSRFWPAFESAWALAGRLGSVALLTHGGPVTFLLETLGMDPVRLKRDYEFDHNNPVPPAGVWQITRPDSAGPWQMELAFLPVDPSKKEPGAYL